MYAMKYASASEHRDFFQKNHFIEFEGLLSEADAAAITTALTKKFDFKKTDPEKLYLAGRDLWRSFPDIKKVVTQRKFALIASELFGTKPIRLGYDQLLFSSTTFSHDTLNKGPFINLFEGSHSLKPISSIDGIVGGVIFKLDGAESTLAAPFPSKMGNGVYFDATFPIPFSCLKGSEKHLFLLVAYAEANSFYLKNEKDPNVNFLKQFDYIFGSKLSIKHHPFLGE